MALPNHVMSCYRLPKTVTRKLTSAMARFWWNSRGSSRGMHWQSWDKLCEKKDDGGLEKPHSLFSRIFKGWYFKNASPMEPIRSYSPSYGWRSIVSARSLVSKGLIKRVGTRSSISVWNDPWIPSTRLRPANCKHQNFDPLLTVDHFINTTTPSWNSQTIQEFDRDGWHFTKNGKYTVKSGYELERVYPNMEKMPQVYGPEVNTIKAFCWKVQCPPKLKHFLLQIVSGCISVKEKLRSRGIQGDVQCSRCAIQVWALSQIPSNIFFFPLQSIFANMDHLFWRISLPPVNHQFTWILWYIWKARNNMVFSNINVDPMDTIQLAETESRIWVEAQSTLQQKATCIREEGGYTLPNILGRWWFIDGSWKDQDLFSRQGWYSTLEGFAGLMGARNTRASLSPLHSEIEALIWAMECMRNLRQFHVTFAMDCIQLVKMVSEPDEWPAFATYLEEIQHL
ncbi:hypothetical protein N665_0383s0053 [Sinapis alba]|nr:hypothetical protein N665_0383s0053 [Sinapis alba]